MEFITITQLSGELGISTRTLRYYEEIGLISRSKLDDYAYRVYDGENVRRIGQITVLRKLRLPLRQIASILNSESVAEIIETFRKNLAELDDQIYTLSAIRDIISAFIARLGGVLPESGENVRSLLTDDAALLDAVNALDVSKPRPSAGARNIARLNKLRDGDARVIHLPEMTAVRVTAPDGCESELPAAIARFIAETGLARVYPAARVFEAEAYALITVPDGFSVPAPYKLERVGGGLYAAHAVAMSAYDEGWERLREWVKSGSFDVREDAAVLEERLNHWNSNSPTASEERQLDLLLPVKPRIAAGTGHPQERVLETYHYNGAPVEVVEWSETIWCGKLGYAANNTDEPDVGSISKGFNSLSAKPNARLEDGWDVCVSVNYMNDEKPNGVMIGFLVGTDAQPGEFDILKLPAGRYMKLSLGDEAALAVGDAPWHGGIPPYKWVIEQLAPAFGYARGSRELPFFEYYGYFNLEKMSHEFKYLYVPVARMSD